MQGMIFFARHGLLPQERELGQRFVVDLELFCDLKPAGITDDIKNAISYAEVYNVVETTVTSNTFNLIEALAENIAREVLQQFRIIKVLVRVKKPAAPVPGIFEYMAVEIIRERQGL